jgi:hypothetical protein
MIGVGSFYYNTSVHFITTPMLFIIKHTSVHFLFLETLTYDSAIIVIF